MEHRLLGKTGFNVPIVGMGTWQTFDVQGEAAPPLKFELIDVLMGVQSVTIYYRRTSGRFAAEVLLFNQDTHVIKGIAHYRE